MKDGLIPLRSNRLLGAAYPRIDPSVSFVGVSTLRKLNAQRLSELNGLLVLQDDDAPLAVLMSYEMFMRIQEHSNIERR